MASGHHNGQHLETTFPSSQKFHSSDLAQSHTDRTPLHSSAHAHLEKAAKGRSATDPLSPWATFECAFILLRVFGGCSVPFPFMTSKMLNAHPLLLPNFPFSAFFFPEWGATAGKLDHYEKINREMGFQGNGKKRALDGYNWTLMCNALMRDMGRSVPESVKAALSL